MAGFDKPLKARALARRQDGLHFNHRTPESRHQTREEMLQAGAASVSALAPAVESVIDTRAICAFGDREILEGSKAGLDLIDLLNE